MKRIPPAVRRELLLDAAFRVIARSGVQSATTRAICAEAAMPLASFHYVFESQQELMRELGERVIQSAGDHERFPELTTDMYRNVELMLRSTFDWAADHPDEELAYYEIANYSLRNGEDFGLRRVEVALELIVRAFHIIEAIHEDQPVVADFQHLAWMVLTFIEGNAVMHLHTRDRDAVYRAIKTFSVFLVDYGTGRVLEPS
ncbi:MAG: TetR family transcriptional regulator [Propionibacteriaceae bacterium]|nr:TetR family transcriptional regulator [Propionibacteriaceae bacterium]